MRNMRLNEIIQRLEQSITAFEAYERALRPAQCKNALEAVRELQTALRSIPPAESLLPPATEHVLPEHGPQTEQALVNVAYAQEQADEARLLLAAYAPYVQSKAPHHLRARRAVISQLRKLVQAAKDLQAIRPVPPRRSHPEYLAVMPLPNETEPSRS